MTEAAKECDARVEIGAGNTDACGCGSELSLGVADVGTGGDQIDRSSDRQLRRSVRNRRVRCELLGELAGRARREDRQTVHRGSGLVLERRPQRERIVEERFAPGHVEIVRQPALLSSANHVERVAQRLNARVEDVETRLRAAKLDIVARDLCLERKLDVPAALLGRLHLRDGCFDVATDAAEEIDLPARIEAGIEQLRAAIAE